MTDISGVQPEPTSPLPVDLPSTQPEGPNQQVEACRADRLKLYLSLAAMAYVILITIIYAYCLMRNVDIKGEASTGLSLLAGFAIGITKDAYGFVFGSSQGSQAKDATIAQLQAKAGG